MSHVVKVVIPWRDRGTDPRRPANLEVVLAWWWAHGFTPVVQDDGLSGDAPFNRHRAYNLAVDAHPEVDVFVFTEADMLIRPVQINYATQVAHDDIGLVVPFMSYRYLSDDTTGKVRDIMHDLDSESLARWFADEVVFGLPAENVIENGRSIGAVNVVSRRTLDLTGGYTEATSGNWYDDRIVEEGWKFLAAPTRHISGPAVHLYHIPGHAENGSVAHLSTADRLATQRNRDLLRMMRRDIRTRNYEAVRALMAKRIEVKS